MEERGGCGICLSCTSLCSAVKSCFQGLLGSRRKLSAKQQDQLEKEVILSSNYNNENNSIINNNNDDTEDGGDDDDDATAETGNNKAVFTRSLMRNSGKVQRRLTKNDIKYLIDQTATDTSQTSSSSVTRLDSLTSRTSAGSGTESNLCRERCDSDRSQESGSSLASYPNASVFERIRTYSFTSGTTGGLSKQQPIVEVRPIEFWTQTREQIQPRLTRLKLLSESGISLEDLRQDLYVSNGRHPSFTLQQSNPQPPTKQGSIEEERPTIIGTSSDNGVEVQPDEGKQDQFGQIHVGLQYSTEDESLLVKIIEARHLPLPVSQDQNDLYHSNPYVKLSLLAAERRTDGWQDNNHHHHHQQQQSQQTSVRRKTQSPVWDERFRFQLSLKEAEGMSLQLTVRDFDKYSRHCCIGQAIIELGQVNLLKGGHFWRSLSSAESTSPDLGNLLVSLNFLPAAGRLNVDVIKAHQILQTDLTNGADSYVKVTQFIDNKEVKKRKTSSIRGTLDPEFDESLSFDLRSDQLQSCSLVFSIWSRQGSYPKSGSRGPSKTLVGRFSMGKYSTGRREHAHWNCLVKYNRSPAARWHALLPQEECERKCAISAYMC